ncbi:MAG: PIG-L family deacetylase [Acidimicrobiales bacterium]|jgi:LmbE family N-acetylglucosaminyl deacetylase
MATVVFFHAHPDDEAIATGGTMAGLSDQGHRVVLVTATRGELGEIPDGLSEGGGSLADWRLAELTEACRILGVGRQTYLDYLDSGMAGEATNDRPGSFAAADIEEAAGALADILVEEAADVLVTYDEHGGYGHPDHVQVHRVGMRAADLAGTPVVYMATMNRDFMRTLRDRVESSEWEPPEGSTDGMDTMGEPAARLTTEVDVTRWLGHKRRAMAAHASQISETSFFLAMPPDVFSTVWGREWYIRVRPPWVLPAGSAWETSLLLEGPQGAGSAAADGAETSGGALGSDADGARL